MATTTNRLSDEQLMSIAAAGRKDLVEKLRPDEKIRMSRLISVYKSIQQQNPDREAQPPAKDEPPEVDAAGPFARAGTRIAQSGGPAAAFAKFAPRVAGGAAMLAGKGLVAGGKAAGRFALGQIANVSGVQIGPEAEKPATPPPSTLVPQSASMRGAQEQGPGLLNRLGTQAAGQRMDALGRAKSVLSDPATAVKIGEVAGRLSKTIATGLAVSYAEFAANPYKQAEEDPVAFLGNLADTFGAGYVGAKAITKVTGALTRAGDVAVETGKTLKMSEALGDEILKYDRLAAEGNTEAGRIAEEARKVKASIDARGGKTAQELADELREGRRVTGSQPGPPVEKPAGSPTTQSARTVSTKLNAPVLGGSRSALDATPKVPKRLAPIEMYNELDIPDRQVAGVLDDVLEGGAFTEVESEMILDSYAREGFTSIMGLVDEATAAHAGIIKQAVKDLDALPRELGDRLVAEVVKGFEGLDIVKDARRGSRIQRSGLRAVPPASGPGSEAGAIRKELVQRLGGTAVGASIGAAIAARNDDGVFSPVGLFVGGAMGAAGGYTLARAFENPKFIRALDEWTKGSSDRRLIPALQGGKGSARVAEASGENLLDEMISPLLSAEPVDWGALYGRWGPKAGAAVGGAGGALAGYVAPDGEPSLANAALGFGVGALSGKMVGGGISSASASSPRSIFRRWAITNAGRPGALQGLAREAHNAVNATKQRTFDHLYDMNKGTKAEREFALEAVKGERPFTDIPEGPMRDAAKGLRNEFDQLGLDLIKYGLVNGEGATAILEGQGKYLPIIYAKHEGDDLLQFMSRQVRADGGDLGRLGDMNYMKGRYETKAAKRVEKLTAERDKLQAQYAEARTLGHSKDKIADIGAQIEATEGRIAREQLDVDKFLKWREENALKDPGYLLGERAAITAQDIEVAKYANAIAANPEYVLPMEVAKSLEEGAEALARKLPKKGGQNQVMHNGQAYRQIPDSRRFGVLRNRYVAEDIAYDIEGLYESTTQLKRAMNKAAGVFKANKVTYNPATLMRNWWGQIPLNDMAGVGPIKGFKTYAEAGLDYSRKGPMWVESRDAGLYGGEWLGAEVRPLLASIKTGDSAFATASRFVDAAASSPLSKMRAFHEGTEQYHKLVLFTHARKKLGLEVADAVKFAKKWGFDYDEVPKWVKWSRKSIFGAPFISFSYKALPRVLESMMAVQNPRQMMRFWKYPMSFAAVSEHSAQKLGLRSEQDTSFFPTMARVVKNGLNLGTGGTLGGGIDFQKYLPDYVGSQQVLLRHTDALGRMNYADLTYSSAWGDLGELGKGNLGRVIEAVTGFSSFPRQLEPGNPILTTLIALMTNYDTFKQRPVVSPDQKGIWAIQEMANFIGRTWLPSLTPGVGFNANAIQKSGAAPSAMGILGGAALGSSIGKTPLTKLAGAAVGGVAGGLMARPLNSKPDLSESGVQTHGVALLSNLGGAKVRPLVPQESADYQLGLENKGFRDLSGTLSHLLINKGMGVDSPRVDRVIEQMAEIQVDMVAKSAEREDLPEKPEAYVAAKAERQEKVRSAAKDIRALFKKKKAIAEAEAKAKRERK